MRTHGINKTFSGFIQIYNSSNSKIDEKINQACSQIIWECTTKYYIISHIKFYFPNDWLLGIARNKAFLNEFTRIAKQWFGADINYIGKVTSKEVGISIKSANESYGYEYKDDDSLEESAYIKNRGDLIINDIWRGFQIKVNKSNRSDSRSYNMYAAYILIRYLFCSNFHQLILDFLYLKNKKNILGIGSEEDFTIFQVAHYGAALKIGYGGFYGFMSNSVQTGAFKLVSLQKFNEDLRLLSGISDNILNTAFGNIRTISNYKEIQELLFLQNIKEIYGKLK